MYKQFFVLMLILNIFPGLRAVEVINNTQNSAILSDFTFISRIEIALMPITLQPGEKFKRNDIESFMLEMQTETGSFVQKFDNLTDGTVIELCTNSNKLN